MDIVLIANPVTAAGVDTCSSQRCILFEVIQWKKSIGNISGIPEKSKIIFITKEWQSVKMLWNAMEMRRLVNQITVTGMVLQATPIAEYDRRVVILSKERGKISAFARGARRPNSALMGMTSPFSFGEFTIYEGRTSYTLVSASISNYFQELRMDVEGAYYGFYFMELADYFAKENVDETQMVNLLFVTLLALLKHKVEPRLIRRIFELKTMLYNGYFAVEPDRYRDETALYAVQFVVSAPVEKLYSFTLQEESKKEFAGIVDRYMQKCTDRHFKSLDILEMID